MPGPLKPLEVAARRALFRFSSRLAGGELPRGVPPGTRLRRVVLMRQDRAGDMIMTLPLLRALRRAHPGTSFTVVASPAGAELLRYEPGVETVVLGRSPAAFLGAVDRIMNLRPDAVADLRMQDSTTAFLFAGLSGAPWTLHAEGPRMLPWGVRVPVPRDGHVMEAFTALLEGLGRRLLPEREDRAPVLGSGERRSASDFLEGFGIPPGRLVSVNVSAGGDNRWWGAERWAAVCRGLLEAGRVPLVLHAGPHRERAAAVAVRAPGSLLPPPTPTILHAAALLERTSLLLSPDTATVHLAASMGIPVAALYLPPEPGLPGWLPWRVPCRVLFSTARESLDDLEPGDLLAAALSLGEGVR